MQKTQISEELWKIINDPKGREELQNILTSGKPGVVRLGDVKYRIGTLERPSGPAMKPGKTLSNG